MKLPVVPTSYQPSTDVFVRAVKRVEAILARTVADETPLDTATVFISRRHPNVRFANYATELTLEQNQGPDEIVEQILTPFKDAGVSCARLESAQMHWPDAWTKAIENHGYRPSSTNVYLLTQNHLPPPVDPGLQILPARAVYPQLRDWYRVMAAKTHHGPSSNGDEYVNAMIDLLDEPRFELFLGRVDGRPVATAGVVSLGQIGVIKGLDILDEPQSDTIGRSLLAHVVEHCARAQFAQVIIELDGGDPDVDLVQSLGFQPVVSFIRFDA